MARSCSCAEGELADPACRLHGLEGVESWPPMNRHAKKVEVVRVSPPILAKDGSVLLEERRDTVVRKETPAEAQRRLYLMSAPDEVRVRAAGFRWPVRIATVPFRFGQR